MRHQNPLPTRYAKIITLPLLWVLGLCLMLVISGNPAQAKDARTDGTIIKQSFYEDATNALSFEEVRHKAFTDYQGILNRGFSSSTFWFRLDLDPGTTPAHLNGFVDGLFILRILPSFLDEIELFDPVQSEGKRRITGTRFSALGDEYKSPNFNFVIRDLDAPRTIWLRLRTNSSSIILFELMRTHALTLADQQQTLFYGIYLGVIFLTFLLALLIVMINRDKVVLVFAIKQLATTLWAFFDRGFYRMLFDTPPLPWPTSFSRLYISFCLVLASLYFDYLFLREFKSSKLGQRVQLGLMGIIITTLFLYLSGQYALGIKLNMIGVTGGILVAWLIALTLPQDELQRDPLTSSVPKFTIVISYSIVIVLLMPAVLPLIGIVPATGLTLNALLYHGLLSSIALASVLGLRARSIVVQQTALQGQLELSQRLAEEERQNRIEQSKFMAMLSHELKTPLAGIRMVAATEKINPQSYRQISDAVDDIDHIIERCLHAERILEGSVTLHKDRLDLADLIGILCQRHSQSSRIDWQGKPLPLIETDLRLLRVILANLIDNACKYSAPETTVTVRAETVMREGQQQIAISVANVPIHDDWPDPQKLFSKYYRSQVAHRVTGSGLGLYLVDQFTRMLKGEIRYAPTDHEVRFIMKIPITI